MATKKYVKGYVIKPKVKFKDDKIVLTGLTPLIEQDRRQKLLKRPVDITKLLFFKNKMKKTLKLNKSGNKNFKFKRFNQNEYPFGMLRPASVSKQAGNNVIGTYDIESLTVKKEDLPIDKYAFYSDSEMPSVLPEGYLIQAENTTLSDTDYFQIPIMVGVCYPILLNDDDHISRENYVVKTFKVDLQAATNLNILDLSLDMMKKVFLFLNRLKNKFFHKRKTLLLYAHNGGRYDAPIMMHNYMKLNMQKILRSKLGINKRKNAFLKLSMCKGVELRDSYQLLPSSLEDLGQQFVKEGKDALPTKIFTLDLFNPENPNYIDPQTLDKYLKKDCTLLYKILVEYYDFYMTIFKIDFSNRLTASSLSQFVFFHHFYKPKWNPWKKKWQKSIFALNEKQDYCIRKAFYGGRTQMFKPQLDNGESWDINSAYVAVMKDYDLPGGKPVGPYPVVDGLGFYQYELNNFFGFCEVEAYAPINNNPITVLPFRLHKHNLIFPKGCFKGWYFSEELKLAKNEGYIFNVTQVIRFEKESNIFKDYLEKLLEIRSKAPKGSPQNTIAKLQGNSLFGKFAMKLEECLTRLCYTKNQFQKLCENKTIDSLHIIKTVDDKPVYVVQTNPLFKEQSLIRNNPMFTYRQAQLRIAPQISAAVASYVRIILYKAMKADGFDHIAYIDTDCYFTNSKKAPPNASETIPGYWKMDSTFEKAIFVAPKVYIVIKKNPVTGEMVYKTKLKGIPKSYLETLSNKFYFDILHGKSEGFSIKGDVSAGLTTLRYDKNTARMQVLPNSVSFVAKTIEKHLIKIYNENNEWVACNPFTVLFNNPCSEGVYEHFRYLMEAALLTYKESISYKQYKESQLKQMESFELQEKMLEELSNPFLKPGITEYNKETGQIQKRTPEQVTLATSLTLSRYNVFQAIKNQFLTTDNMPPTIKREYWRLEAFVENFKQEFNCKDEDIIPLLTNIENDAQKSLETERRTKFKPKTKKPLPDLTEKFEE